MAGFQGHRARKRFGQNFLQDPGMIRRIVRAIAPRGEDRLVEIGPGMGAITELLLEENRFLDVVELDRDLIPGLKVKFFNHSGFQVHEADALKFDFAGLRQGDEKLRVVGNLPYNISTPLIFHLLSFQGLIEDMHFMLQKEVVERLAASPGSGQWGRLSVMAQYYCQVEFLFEVPPECFNPRPKVDSAIVRLTPHTQRPFVAADEQLLADTVRLAFAQRRKTLRNNLKGVIAAEVLELLGIDPQRRPETLTLEEFVKLANHRLDTAWQPTQ
ncbi:16S rRNA (adenine(1518)-N(6)/adenine(1519)-N(6))-dimethyltransferase RsmA [Marinospirillum alkaliphilum]|uniref:Ribosomal RNA small subunit methyltransferase A n=1 Tax=Marinospirillum alkaliphilum DSM 21637 TaxID=1122209 RepID=A0A1K1VIL8_9GAMM|nr:16S rRNA (adenine(1518)-N(6)/adenine(1519)-N(6))-dimethyltransferase RsmA [Marinospirillum alkaliphilum]SFX24540.1 16S rRNA (adenine1518-N6/adenine1519-N6)-dimethyltransferase [Marinospirillum alkaliphilum DSM 21637]